MAGWKLLQHCNAFFEACYFGWSLFLDITGIGKKQYDEAEIEKKQEDEDGIGKKQEDESGIVTKRED